MKRLTRLLIVDDDESVALTLKAVLEQDGQQASTANSIAEVSALLKKEQFDVALVDLRLGEEDGIDVLKILRARQPDCVAIMLTGFASLESAVAAIRLGAYDYLIKPCDLEELKLAIKGAAERGATQRVLRTQLEKQQKATEKVRSRTQKLQTELERVTAELEEKIRQLGNIKGKVSDPK